MSHGSSGGGDKAEPNLVPLLDMVLQLVMFFIMVCNFTMAEVDESVKLPLAQMAKAPDPSLSEVLYLNLNAKGELVVPNRVEALATTTEIGTYLKQVYRDVEELSRSKGDKSGEVKTVVIIRGHRDAEFAPVFNVLREAKLAGFKKWQLRATISQ